MSTSSSSNKKYNLQDPNFCSIHLNTLPGTKGITHITKKTKDIILNNHKKFTKIEDFRKLISESQYKKIESVFYIPQDPKEIIRNLTNKVEKLESENKDLKSKNKKLEIKVEELKSENTIFIKTVKKLSI
jgi:chaperonin cofactor prefoldin